MTRAAGLEALISHRPDSNQAVLALVAADPGVALMRRSAVTSQAGITLLGIPGPPKIVRQVHLTSRAGDLNPAIGELTPRTHPSSAVTHPDTLQADPHLVMESFPALLSALTARHHGRSGVGGTAPTRPARADHGRGR